MKTIKIAGIIIATLLHQAALSNDNTDTIDPFLSAKARENLILDIRKAEAEKISKIRDEVIKATVATTPQRQNSKTYEILDGYPHTLAIIGTKGDSIIIRERNSLIRIKSGDTFLSNDEVFIAYFIDAKTIGIKRKRDDKLLFNGMVGSIFSRHGDGGRNAN